MWRYPSSYMVPEEVFLIVLPLTEMFFKDLGDSRVYLTHIFICNGGY